MKRIIAFVIVLGVLCSTSAASGASVPLPPPGGYSTTIRIARDGVPGSPFACSFWEAGCIGGTVPCYVAEAFYAHSYDSGCPLHHDDSLTGGRLMEVGALNDCVDIGSVVPGRSHYCRVVRGFNDRHSGGPSPLRDGRNYVIDLIAGKARTSRLDPGHGLVVSLWDGRMFEGCVLLSKWDGVIPLHSAFASHTIYYCDYQITKTVILQHGIFDGATVLRAIWDSTWSNARAADCAFALMGLVTGATLIPALFSGAVCAEQLYQIR